MRFRKALAILYSDCVPMVVDDLAAALEVMGILYGRDVGFAEADDVPMEVGIDLVDAVSGEFVAYAYVVDVVML